MGSIHRERIQFEWVQITARPFDSARTTTATTPKSGSGAPSSTSSPNGQGPALSIFEQIANGMIVAGALAQGNTSGSLNQAGGHRNGMPGGQNVGGISFPLLQAGVATFQILNGLGASVKPEKFFKSVFKAAKKGQRTVIEKADKAALDFADGLIKDHGQYKMAAGLEEMQTIMPYEMASKFTQGLGNKFQAHKIFDVAKVEEYKYGGGKIGLDIEIKLEEGDERIAKVCSLLTQNNEYHTVDREDIYTEEELQNAPLLDVSRWVMYAVATGHGHGTTYDFSNACKKCGTGVRQTSPLVIANDDERSLEKMHIAATMQREFLVPDALVEKLVNAKLTGLNLWRIYGQRKSIPNVELRREQMFAENVLPPMSSASTLDRKDVCPVCHRGHFTFLADVPARIVYRAEDLKNIQDVNRTWEWFTCYGTIPEDGVERGMWPAPSLLVTPKVMNLLSGKTKKEKKYEGVSFTPVWIEGQEPWRVTSV